jgi:hypothetical protein
MSQSDKITVTRALVELKTLEKRIVKAVGECDLIKTRRKEDKWDVQEYCRNAQAAYQSACDLIARRDQLKSKVIASNALTVVKIGKEELTVAEALDRKKSLLNKKSLLHKLRTQKDSAQSTHEARTEELRNKLDRLLEVNFGKDVRNGSSDSISTITKSFYETNKVEIVDPLNLASKIKALDDEITEFEKEVDLVLSEANAMTFI